MTATTFPPDFVWGAATVAYQIEGSPLADGAGREHLASFLPTRPERFTAATTATSPATTIAALPMMWC